MADEESTKQFDHEILREAVYSSEDSDLIHDEIGHITSHRHPAGKPRAAGSRGRIIKICLPSQELRDSLLTHMRSGRQSLTERFVHSYARRDYTVEELQLDRSLRKQAGDLNALKGEYVADTLPTMESKETRRAKMIKLDINEILIKHERSML
ncbi:hypothetical protein ANCDUO_22824 [Ancylostoma duodenale]|uniref:Uncharacterized protein n=1 Tax=Ancylostoma duodenale TaxID=51022 RepID=A0A0C2FEV4_9BILA|nr:hypothetical protein ANCDUO_22824 [Ancylostoma duodenale]